MKIAIVPIGDATKAIPDPKRLKRAIMNAGRGTSKDILNDYKVTMQTWRNPSPFKIDEEKWWRWVIATGDKKYLFVSGGTRPHPIRPKNAPYLRFQWGGPGSYQAKTTPRVIRSRAGGPSGPIVYRREVMHPGTKAREFEKVVSEKWRKEWPRNLWRAIASEF